MSNYLERDIDLYQVQVKQDTAVCALKTLSYLLDANATNFKGHQRFDPEEFAYGLSGLLKVIANDLHDASGDISELHDQLRHEGVRK